MKMTESIKVERAKWTGWAGKKGKFGSHPKGIQKCYVKISPSPSISQHAECTIPP